MKKIKTKACRPRKNHRIDAAIFFADVSMLNWNLGDGSWSRRRRNSMDIVHSANPGDGHIPQCKPRWWTYSTAQTQVMDIFHSANPGNKKHPRSLWQIESATLAGRNPNRKPCAGVWPMESSVQTNDFKEFFVYFIPVIDKPKNIWFAARPPQMHRSRI
jgi:hypothetical protein